MQGLNKNYYNRFVHMLVDSVTLYRIMACCLLVHHSKIKVISDQELVWSNSQITVKGDDRSEQEKEDYYQNQARRGYLSCSKYQQIDGSQIYVVGGGKYYPSLLEKDYDVGKSCIKVYIDSSYCIEKA